MVFEQLPQDLFNDACTGITLFTADGKLSYANDTFFRLLNESRDVVLDVDAHSFVETGKSSVCLFERTFITRRVSNEPNYIYTNKFGERYHINLTHVPIFASNGELQYVLGFNRDIFKLKDKQDDGGKKPLTYFNVGGFVYASEQSWQIVTLAEKLASISTNILIVGETGVGKDVIAHYLHNSGPRKNERFVAVNCATLPESLIESELFGYEKGSFTGASSSGKIGLLEQADGGTLFLDEINSLPLALQAKFLTALETKRVRRIGSQKEIKVDFALISATNQDLKKSVAENLFRRDLYYRINVFSIEIPPLRERRQDILALTQFFLDKYNSKYDRSVILAPSYMRYLENQSWPGNVRELKNHIEKLVVLSEQTDFPIEKSLELTSSPLFFGAGQRTSGDLAVPMPDDEAIPLRDALEIYEIRILKHMLSKQLPLKEVARQLDIPAPTLSRKLHKYNLK